MFSSMPSLYAPILAALIAVWGAAYIAGMTLGTPNEDRSRRLARPAKLVMIGTTLAAGGLWLNAATGTEAGRFARLIMLGLTACAIGDVVLAGFLPLRQPETPAMAVFGIGHGLYLAAILTLRTATGAHPDGWLAGVLLVGAAAAVAAWALFVRHPDGSRALNAGSLVYGILLFVATAAGAELAVRAHQTSILAVGMGLFVASDLLLARYLVRKAGFPYVRDVVWILYSAGQMAIAFSIGAAAAVGY